MIEVETTATMLINVCAVPTDTFALRILEAHLHNEMHARWVGTGGGKEVCEELNELADERSKNLRMAITAIKGIKT